LGGRARSLGCFAGGDKRRQRFPRKPWHLPSQLSSVTHSAYGKVGIVAVDVIRVDDLPYCSTAFISRLPHILSAAPSLSSARPSVPARWL
jgi:hypothetical protein